MKAIENMSLERSSNDRWSFVLHQRKSGETFKSIGSKLGVSASRARQIYLRAERKVLRDPKWTQGLSTRVANALFNCGIESRADAIRECIKGRLMWSKVDSKDGVRNFGKSACRELYSFLGIQLSDGKRY